MPPPIGSESAQISLTDILAKAGVGGVATTSGIVASLPFMNVKNAVQLESSDRRSWMNRLRLLAPFLKDPRRLFVGTVPLSVCSFPAMGLANTTDWYARKRLQEMGYHLTPLSSAGISAFSGGISSLFVNPAELVFIRMGVTQQKMMDVVQEIYREHGMRGFLRGMPHTVGRMTGFTAVYHELALDHPVIATLVGSAITHPSDTAKTLVQSDFSSRATLITVLKNSPFRGVAARILGYAVFMVVAPRVRRVFDD